MFTERTSIGMDVHARSVRAAAIDTVSGEVIEATVGPAVEPTVAWVRQVAADRGPVAVTYEAVRAGTAWPGPWPRPGFGARWPHHRS